MSRFAIGDLLVDIELSAQLRCSYVESGALKVDDSSRRFEIRISGITVYAKSATDLRLCVASVTDRAAKKGAMLERISEDLVFYRERSTTEGGGESDRDEFWLVGFGNREIVITLSVVSADKTLNREPLRAAVETAIRSIRLIYQENSPTKNPITVIDLADSQRPWLDHHRQLLRRRVQQATGFDADGLVPLPVLDEYWGCVITSSPSDNNELNLILNSVGVALGDHLVRSRPFEWAVISDAYGVCIGVVALRGTANVTTDPFNYVAKRWERKEAKFLVAAVQAISETFDECAADWRVAPNKKIPWWAFWGKATD